jgi:hypothetical protein
MAETQRAQKPRLLPRSDTGFAAAGAAMEEAKETALKVRHLRVSSNNA